MKEADQNLEALCARRLKLAEPIQGLIDERRENLVLFGAADLDGD